MNERDFCYWLQGYMENTNPQYINEDVTKSIKEHLNLVFNKVTPQATYCINGGTQKLDRQISPSDIIGPDEVFTIHTGIKNKPLC